MNNVLEYLEDAAVRYPDRIALDDGTDTITYKELRILARKVGCTLRKDTVSPYVGVQAERDIYTPIMFIGVLYAGKAYVPIDGALIQSKREKIMADAGIERILTKEDVLKLADEGVCGSALDESAMYDELDEVAQDKKLVHSESFDAPLYVIYTSGSTGEPKGVVKTHGAMIDFLESFERRFELGQQEVIGNQTPFSFDASAKDIYISIKKGATLQIIPTKFFSFPVKLVEYLNEKKVTTICWVPSALSMISAVDTFAQIKPDTLKNVFFVGELFPAKQLNKWRKELPYIRYVNLYGSSEIAGVCCSYEIKPDYVLKDDEVLPIGKPFDNTEVVLKDGEIYIASEALFIKYLNDATKTQKSFYMGDLTGEGEKCYFKTGDMAHYDDNGDLVFTSRMDHQIKHMGYRIELGEIETAALTLDEVVSCGCVYDSNKRSIVLFCQCDIPQWDDKKLAAVIRTKLKDVLAPYMIPKVMIVDKIPLNANGKVDRIALAEMV